MLEVDMIQEHMYLVMICTVEENLVMDTGLEDMIETDKEVMIEKQEVLVDTIEVLIREDMIKEEEIMSEVDMVKTVMRMVMVCGIEKHNSKRDSDVTEVQEVIVEIMIEVEMLVAKV